MEELKKEPVTVFLILVNVLVFLVVDLPVEQKTPDICFSVGLRIHLQ